MTAYNWLCFVRVWGKYFLRYVWDLNDKQAVQHYQLLCEFIDLFRTICQHEITTDEIAELRTKIKSALHAYETIVPVTEHDIIIHLMHHIPDQLERYGPCRTWWMFHVERFFGWCSRAVHKHNDVEASLMNTYKFNFCIGVKPAVVGKQTVQQNKKTRKNAHKSA
jgi:hypothetical protein